MADKKKTEEFYANLKRKLEESSSWPTVYLYKFIVPASSQKIAEIEEIFDGLDAEIAIKNSSKGSYTSVSIRVKMESPNHVIAKYKEVGQKVADVISL